MQYTLVGYKLKGCTVLFDVVLSGGILHCRPSDENLDFHKHQAFFSQYLALTLCCKRSKTIQQKTCPQSCQSCSYLHFLKDFCALCNQTQRHALISSMSCKIQDLTLKLIIFKPIFFIVVPCPFPSFCFFTPHSHPSLSFFVFYPADLIKYRTRRTR